MPGLILTQTELNHFKKKIWDYYQQNQRHFPWRETADPYAIVISEFMLQQTQTDRVLPKYMLFINSIPDFKSLDNAPVSKILGLWNGLGYNRRALLLKKLAQIVVREYNGRVPSDAETLIMLPGIGKATAGAISAFAFNLPVIFIETNIRRVFIDHFFPNKNNILDGEIIELIEQTLDQSDPKNWYYSLMDYGAMLGKGKFNVNRKSAVYNKQSKFSGSKRQLRGEIIRLLLKKPLQSKQILKILNSNLAISITEIDEILNDLANEKFIKIGAGEKFTIAD